MKKHKKRIEQLAELQDSAIRLGSLKRGCATKTDPDTEAICEILMNDYKWSNPDWLKGLDDIIKATKQLIKLREKTKYCKCSEVDFLIDVQFVCKSCNKIIKR